MILFYFWIAVQGEEGGQGREAEKREAPGKEGMSCPSQWAAPALFRLQVGDGEEASVQGSGGVGCSVRPACVGRRS